MKRQEPIYADLDLALTRNALSGDVGRFIDAQSVRRAILRVIKIRRFDIPYQSDKHAFVEEFLFDPASVATAAALKDRVEYALKKMEPRATYKVDITPRSTDLGGEVQGYDLEIEFEIKSLGVKGVITDFLERAR